MQDRMRPFPAAMAIKTIERATGQPLPGAVFTLHNGSDCLGAALGAAVTDASGMGDLGPMGQAAYSVQEVIALARYTSEAGESWQAATDGYEIVVLDPRDPPSHLDDLLAEPGTRLVYRDERIEVLRRSY